MIECESCLTNMLYRDEEDKVCLDAYKIEFSPSLNEAHAVCRKCRHKMSIPLSLYKEVKERLLKEGDTK